MLFRTPSRRAPLGRAPPDGGLLGSLPAAMLFNVSLAPVPRHAPEGGPQFYPHLLRYTPRPRRRLPRAPIGHVSHRAVALAALAWWTSAVLGLAVFRITPVRFVWRSPAFSAASLSSSFAWHLLNQVACLARMRFVWRPPSRGPQPQPDMPSSTVRRFRRYPT